MDQLRQHCEKRLSLLFSFEDRLWVRHRLKMEFEVIEAKGQMESFEQAQWAAELLKLQGSTFQLVGAGCSSLVSYVMGISDVNPWEHSLLYERFLEASSSGKIHFQFVVHPPIGRAIDDCLSLKSNSAFDTVRIQPATLLESLPSLVTQAIQGTIPGFELTSIPLNDVATFKALMTNSVHEIEGSEILSEMKPRCLTDIAAFTAIRTQDFHDKRTLKEFIRRKSKPTQRSSENWLAERILLETRGMILFQEQIMLMLNQIADIPLTDAYQFIKAVCKQEWEHVATIREWFMVGSKGNGIEESVAHTLFQEIMNTAATSACKAHHLSQALTLYRTAFLKTHFPSQFSMILQTVQQ